MADSRDLIVGTDPMSPALIVLDRERVIADGNFIQALLESRTLRDVRRHGGLVLTEVRDSYINCGEEDDPAFESLPDETPFSVITWFGDDSWYMKMPLARLLTAETAPTEVMKEYGQRDTSYGLDYEPATWLDPDEVEQIVARLRQLGHRVDDGPEAQALLDRYSYLEAQ